MPTFASPTSNPAVHHPRSGGRRKTRGFTLIELLVVITIVAVLMGIVVMGFIGADQAQRQRGVAEQLAQRLQLARQQSIQRNSTWGVIVEPDGYRFLEYDAINQSWIEQSQRPFAPVAITDQLELSAKVEGETQIAGNRDEDQVQPDLLFFASGEVTPFTLLLETQEREVAFELSSDGFSSIQLTSGEAES